jgi:Ca2+-dependent lipid-binding protein
METTENVNTTVPVNNNTTDNQIDNQGVQPAPEAEVTPAPNQEQAPVAQPASEAPVANVAPETQPVEGAQPAPETQPTDTAAAAAAAAAAVLENEEHVEQDDEGETSEEKLDVVEQQEDGKKVTIDGPAFVSEMFSENPGEVSKFLNMTPKELKKEQDKMKRKGRAMDNKFANLFLLQSIRDECGILVFACLASWLLTRLGFSIYWTIGVMLATMLAYLNFNKKQKHLYYNKERKAYNQKIKLNPV